MLSVGSLFSGIGGVDLGLERAGMEVAWQSEIDPFCCALLERRWGVDNWGDIRYVDWEQVGRVDVLAGGFPCPVVSSAARGRNVGEWLWPHFAATVRILRPRYVVVENVEALLRRRLGDVLWDLANLGYAATWRLLRASDFGAPHHRARVWVVGYPDEEGQPDLSLDDEVAGLPQLRLAVRDWADPPSDLRVADGVPARVDRLQALGNSVVPDMAEWIGRRIVSYEEAMADAV